VVDAGGAAIDDAVWIPLGEEEGILSLHGNPVLVAAVADRLAEIGVTEETGSIARWTSGGSRPEQEALERLAAAPTAAGALFLLGQAGRIEEWARRGASEPGSIDTVAILAALSRRIAALPFDRAPRIVLAGAPNAGKSTLFNRLIGRERVVVDERPGTTRDQIEELSAIADRPVLWVDGAGLRDAADEIEREGVRRMRESVAAADLVVLLIPPWGEVPDLPEREGRPLLRIRSRADSIPAPAAGAAGPLPVSGVTGAGIPELLSAAARALFGGEDFPQDPTPFAPRQVAALEDVIRRRESGDDERPAWRALGGEGEEVPWGDRAT
jgi:hypothetical protein